jgi:hypothetical protein
VERADKSAISQLCDKCDGWGITGPLPAL